MTISEWTDCDNEQTFYLARNDCQIAILLLGGSRDMGGLTFV